MKLAKLIIPMEEFACLRALAEWNLRPIRTLDSDRYGELHFVIQGHRLPDECKCGGFVTDLELKAVRLILHTDGYLDKPRHHITRIEVIS